MNKKIVVTLIVLLFCVSCLGIVSADNSTNETSDNNESIDLSNYIVPISISSKVIEFNDGFTGFCLDSTKESITTEDGFTSQSTSSDEIQNYVKLAIIEAYKQGCEDNLGQIIASFADGSYKNSGDKVITEVLKSDETIGNEAVVDLEDSIEGTFEFELLKPATGDKSDCLAYKVSLKEVPSEDKLAAVADDNATEELDKNNDTDDALTNSSDETQDKEKATDSSNATGNDEKAAVSKDNDAEKDKKTEDEKDNAAEKDKKTENVTDNKTDENKNTKNTTNENKTPEKIINETNKTIVNKTNTLIVNENNTTIVNKTTITHINKTTNDTPQNETIPEKLIKTVGNPMFILIVAIAIAAIAAVAMRRKDQ